MRSRSRLAALLMAGALAAVGVVMFGGTASAAPAGPAGSAKPAAPVAAAAGNFYQITNKNSGSCLDVRSEDNYYSVGARVQLYHCTGVLEQHWAIAFAPGSQYFSLVSQRSGYCMEPSLIPGNTNGVQVDQAVCNGLDYQLWQSVNTGTGFAYLLNKNGLCLDVSGGSTADHAKIQMWQCNGTGAQLWQFH